MQTDRFKDGEAVCRLCGKSGPEMLPAVLVRAPIVEQIKKQHPDWKAEGYICQADLLEGFFVRHVQLGHMLDPRCNFRNNSGFDINRTYQLS